MSLVKQLKRSWQGLFGFSRKLRLMPSHENSGHNNEDQHSQTKHEHHPPAPSSACRPSEYAASP